MYRLMTMIENNVWYKNAILAISISFAVWLFFYYGGIVVLQNSVRALDDSYQMKKILMKRQKAKLFDLQKISVDMEVTVDEGWFVALQILANQHELKLLQVKESDNEQKLLCQLQGGYHNIVLWLADVQKPFANYIALREPSMKPADNGVDVVLQLVLQGSAHV